MILIPTTFSGGNYHLSAPIPKSAVSIVYGTPSTIVYLDDDVLPVQPRTFSGKVGAYYFAGWRTNDPEAITYRPNPWAASDTANNIFVGDGGHFPDRTPEIGHYDETLQSVIDYQIETASAGGLDFFAFDFYFKDAPPTAVFNHALDLFVSSTIKSKMQFCLAFINGSHADKFDLTYWYAAIDKIATYFSDPQYLKIGGKPVVQFFDQDQWGAKFAYAAQNLPSNIYRGVWTAGRSYALGDCVYVSATGVFYTATNAHTAGATFAGEQSAHWVQAIAAGSYAQLKAAYKWLIDLTRSRLGSNVYLVALGSVHPYWSGTYGMIPAAGFDALSAYNYHNGYDPASYVSSSGGGSANAINDRAGLVSSGGAPTFADLDWCYQQNWESFSRGNSGLKYWVPVTVGWDKRPWTAISQRYPSLYTSATKHNGNCSPTIPELESHFTSAKQFAIRNSAITDGMIMIYAWNEIGEGGYLIPTVISGRKKLETLRKVFKDAIDVVA